MRLIVGAAGGLLLVLAFGLVVVAAMSMGGADIMLAALLLSGALVAGGIALIDRAARPRPNFYCDEGDTSDQNDRH